MKWHGARNACPCFVTCHMAFQISPYWAGAMPGERGGEKGREGDAGNVLPLYALLRKINTRFIFK